MNLFFSGWRAGTALPEPRIDIAFIHLTFSPDRTEYV